MKTPSPTPHKRNRKRSLAVETALNVLENERRYVAKELHDSVAQTTLQLGLQAGICRKLLERGNLEILGQELIALEGRIQLASAQVRDVIADMRPPRLESEAPVSEYLQSAVKTHRDRGGAPVEVQVNLPVQPLRLSVVQKLTLTRIVQEALLNVRKHARAKHVRLCLDADAETIYLVIADDGKGFDLAEVEALPVDRGGAGLANLRARTEALGGTLTIGRDTAGEWTEVRVTLPR